jgi:hypothetical protein
MRPAAWRNGEDPMMPNWPALAILALIIAFVGVLKLDSPALFCVLALAVSAFLLRDYWLPIPPPEKPLSPSASLACSEHVIGPNIDFTVMWADDTPEFQEEPLCREDHRWWKRVRIAWEMEKN